MTPSDGACEGHGVEGLYPHSSIFPTNELELNFLASRRGTEPDRLL